MRVHACVCEYLLRLRAPTSVLAAGFRKNKVLREVTLSDVPTKLVESVKRTLSMNTALTTVIVIP